MKKPPGAFCLFVHPHWKSFPSVTPNVIPTVVGPTGTRQEQSTAEARSKRQSLPWRAYRHREWLLQQDTVPAGTSASTMWRTEVFLWWSFVAYSAWNPSLGPMGGRLKGMVLAPRISPVMEIVANHETWGILQEKTQNKVSCHWQSKDIHLTAPARLPFWAGTRQSDVSAL